MVMIPVDYKSIEKKEYRGLGLASNPDDVFELKLGITEGVPTVDIAVPWGSTYNLGEYDTGKKAERAMREFVNQLDNGYRPRIKPDKTAELVLP